MIASQGMNNERLNVIIEKMATKMIDSQMGFWRFEFDEALLFVITDESHKRMRIMSPIVETESVEPEVWMILMSANFDRALDARYCVNDDMLWSAFIHPLQELESRQFVDGLKQVATLAKNYGTSFSSSDLMFGG